MASIQGPVVCPVVHAKQTGVYSVPVDSPLLKAKLVKSGFLGVKGLTNGIANVGYRQNLKNLRPIRCSLSSSSDGNGSMAENSSEKNADYVNSSVVEAGISFALLLLFLPFLHIFSFLLFHGVHYILVHFIVFLTL